MTEFAAPAAATGVVWADLKGCLLVIEPHVVEQGINTAFGAKEAVRADVHVLDGRKAGETFHDTLVFPNVLISQLRPSLGQKVLGRLGQGTAKPGQAAPWKLDPATPADQGVAKAWLDKKAPAFAAPTTAAPPF